MENLDHSASFHSWDKIAPLKSGIKHLAVNIASDMALSILQAGSILHAEPSAPPAMEAAATGLYHAAMMLIARDYVNPQLNPAGLAVALGCSRASLFRAFRQQQQSIADAIWTARLKPGARHVACARVPHLADQRDSILQRLS